MDFKSPEVYLIGQPEVIVGNSRGWGPFKSDKTAYPYKGARAYLEAVGASDCPWLVRAEDFSISDPALLVEFGGRLCYRSWEPGLNPNVTKVREDPHEYLANIIRSGHGSVLEHAMFNFVFHNVSRVFTHELVRHRVGTAMSQESLRYVRLDAIDFYLPEGFQDHKDAVMAIVERLEEVQKDLASSFELDEKGTPFSEKKKITSAMRRLAPIGLLTSIMWSANVRTLRHVIEMRTSIHAEEEIRLVFSEVAEIMQSVCPELFCDMSQDDDDQWVFENSKI